MFVPTKLKTMIYIKIIREISKLIIFIILWGFPLVLSRWNEDNSFLWFFALTVIVTAGVFSHYETLDKVDNINDTDGSDE